VDIIHNIPLEIPVFPILDDTTDLSQPHFHYFTFWLAAHGREKFPLLNDLARVAKHSTT
jgi:hypothetical protein